MKLNKSTENHIFKILFTKMNTTKISFTLLCILLLLSCGSNVTNNTDENTGNENTITLTAEQLQNSGIETGMIEQKQVSSVLKVNGKIDVPPQNMVSISVPLGGYLKSTRLLPGMPVHKGEILATIEDIQYIQLQQDLLVARAQLSSLESEYNRQLDLNKDKAISDKVFQQTRANYITQKITIKSLEEKLSLIGVDPQKLNENTISKSINIYSPINGFTSKVNANIGKYINPSEVLIELVDPTDIHLNLNIYEKDIHKLYIGQKLWAYTNIHPEIKHDCQILLISKDINNNGSTEVHCHFDNYDKTLIPGMYMNAEIEIRNNLADVLPESAIVRFEGKQFIFEAGEKNLFTMTEVQTGEIENGNIEIISGSALKGKKIVTNGAYTLLMTLKNKEE